MDSSDLRKLVRLQAKQIAELEDEIEEFEDSAEDSGGLPEISAAELSDLETRCETAERERDAVRATLSALRREHDPFAKAEVERLRARVQLLEAERHEVKLQAEKRIVAALGKFDGNWLDEACERLTRRREMTAHEVGGIISLARAQHPTSWAKVAVEVCEQLAIQIRKDVP